MPQALCRCCGARRDPSDRRGESCAACAEGPVSGGRYHLVVTGSGREGPFSYSEVVSRLAAGQLDGSDGVQLDTGEALRMASHPHFAACFVVGTVPRAELLRALIEREERRLKLDERDEHRRRWRTAAPWAALLLPLVLLLLPVMDGEGLLRTPLGQTWYRLLIMVDQDAALELFLATRGLPGEEIISTLQSRWSGVAPSGGQRLELAWFGLNQGTTAGLETARMELEATLGADPLNVGVTVELAVVYFRLADFDPSLRAQAIELMERIAALDPTSVELRRLRAGMGMFDGGSRAEAVARANACLEDLPSDPICTWYLGRALLQTGQGEEALAMLQRADEQLGDVPIIDMALGQAALETQHLSLARQHLSAYQSRYPDDAQSNLAFSAVLIATGEATTAIWYAEQAARLQPTLLDGPLRAGQLLLHTTDYSERALQHLSPLVGVQTRDPHMLGEILLSVCIAAGVNRDAELVERACGRLVKEREGWAPGHLAFARAAHLAGVEADINELLNTANTDLLFGRQESRFHLGVAQLLDELGRPEAAVDARRRAVRSDPNWTRARVELAGSFATLGNLREASRYLSSTWTMDAAIGEDTTRIPDVMLEPIDTTAISDAMSHQRAAASLLHDVQVSLGALEAMRCINNGTDCDAARKRLRRATRANPGDPAAKAWLARVMMQQGDVVRAGPYVPATSSSEEVHAIIHAMSARVAGANGDLEEMERSLRLIGTSREFGSGALLAEQAMVMKDSGDTPRALAMARRALAKEPDRSLTRQLLLDLEGFAVPE